MRILLVEPGKSPQEADIGSSLQDMQNIVGGVIQAVYPFEEAVALICNEEGKLLSLPPNRFLCHPDTGEPYDIVCGTFFLCAAPADSENFKSLTEEQIQRYSNYYKGGLDHE